MELNKVYQGDCLEIFPSIPDKSVNLIIIDPPYNIGKDKWDKWKTVELYVEFMGEVFTECQRVLKDNGSFYFFHNDFLQIVELQNWLNKNSSFVFKSLITIDKKDNNYIKDLYGSQNHFRNYLNLAEYLLFYTFQDETGLTKIYSDRFNFISIRNYMRSELDKTKLSKKEVNHVLCSAVSGGGMACHIFGDTDQWTLPTKEKYEKLQITGYFQRPYESLRQEYESLRYTFNKKEGLKNIWSYAFREDKRENHPTQKPLKLIQDIIKHSSNENDIVLDCFGGSGTTAIACMNTNRNYILIEKEPKYVEIANKRIKEAQAQFRLAI